MKILIIGSYAESIINFRGHLINELISNGAQVHVAAPGLKKYLDDKIFNPYLLIHDIPMKRTGMNPMEDIVLFFRMIKLFIEIRPSHFLGYTIKPVIYGSICSFLTLVPSRSVIITGLGYIFYEGNNYMIKKIVKLLYYLALRCSQNVIFQNIDDQCFLEKMNIITNKTKKYIINGSGVSLTYFSFSPVQLTKIKILMIGRLLKQKGVLEYISAAEIIKSLSPEVEFEIAGWIDDNPDSISNEEFENLKKSKYIKYLGKLNDVKESLIKCSIFVLPSYREGTPRTVLEAMAIGRAIITTNAPGCRETVIHGYNGLLVEPKNVDSLVNSLKYMINNPSFIMLMGRNSRIIAEKKYDVNIITSQIIKIIKN